MVLDQRAQVQRSLCDVTKTSTPVTKTLSNFTILSYRDVDTSVLPLFASTALFVAGKGRFGFTKIGPKKCEGSRNFPIVWFLQLGFSRRLEWATCIAVSGGSPYLVQLQTCQFDTSFVGLASPGVVQAA